MSLHRLFDASDPEELRMHEEYVAQRLRTLADQMADVARLLEHISEAKSVEMIGASRMAISWADAIEREGAKNDCHVPGRWTDGRRAE